MKESIRQFDATIRCLADRWSGARPLLPGFPLLARGRPLATDQIAKVAGISNREIDEVLENARCTLNENGHLIDLFGMMLTPTYHRLEIDGKSIFSCCALWAHVIPKLVDRMVLVESVDPYNSEMVRLEITPEKVKSIKPSTSVATMAVVEPSQIERDVGSAFCRHVRHFASSESACNFAAEFSSRRIVEIEEIHELAIQLYEAIWKSMCDDEDRKIRD